MSRGHWHGLLRAPDGRIVAGYALDATGAPTWWAVDDGSRRRKASSQREAQGNAEEAARAHGWAP